ncbi:MAG: hypothetical protein E6J00_01775 [Chloroflexi bacterium]|nr:MAG: hypothetical protein E6J00_01775 [Chloroflexota bacterium]
MVGRLSWVVGSVVAVILVVVAFLGAFVLRAPGPLQGPTTNIHLETVAAVNQAVEWARPNDPHPDWVSYLPTTILRVPANATIKVTIDQEDGATGLRNPFWGQVQGTDGNKMHVKYTDDNGNQQEADMTSIDPTRAAHTFAVPDLGVFVPLLGVSDNAAPGATNVITFTFHTKGKGIYHWQCFVPCAAGTVFGNGGPMQTLGYMAGQLIVE